MSRDYSVAAVEKAIRVVEYMGGGEILEWKSAVEVAKEVGVTKNEAFRILKTLEKVGWAEQSEKGWRQAPTGIVKYSLYVQEYLSGQATRLGIRSML